MVKMRLLVNHLPRGGHEPNEVQGRHLAPFRLKARKERIKMSAWVPYLTLGLCAKYSLWPAVIFYPHAD